MNILKQYQGLFVLSWVYGVNFFSTLFMIMSAGRLAYDMGYIALATLPMGIQYTGIMFGAIPVSKILMIFGVKKGFSLMQSVGVLASVLMITAVMISSFTILLIASFVMGIFIASNHQIRYMASDTVTMDKKSIAVSIILATSIIGGLFASGFANIANGWTDTPFLGIFYAHLFVNTLGLIALLVFKIPVQKIVVKNYSINFSLLKKDGMISAILILAIAYGSMTFLMTLVPILMHKMDINIFKSNTAVGYHALGMSLPSLIVGYIISKTTAKFTILIGAFVFMSMVYLHIFVPATVFTLSLGLVLLGVGWCAMFVAGTTLVTKILTPSERVQIQGFVDFCVFSLTAVSALSAGIALHYIGWQGANAIVFSGAVIIVVLTLSIKKNV